jgi:membrane associated rhomboid family serine protease
VQADVQQETDDDMAWWRRLPQRPITATLIALCLLAYTASFAAAVGSSAAPLDTAIQSLWSLEGSEAVLVKLGALDLTRVWVDGEWWRVLTTGFLHGSWLHLLLNMTALGSIGDWVEHAWGPWRTLLLFLASSAGGCLASLMWCESQMVVGASAGVLGQAGALWLARRFGPENLQTKIAPISVLSLGILIILCLSLGVVIPGIAQAGHLGGLLTGAALGWLLLRKRPAWLAALGGLGIASGLLAVALLGRSPTWQVQYHAMLGFRATVDGQLESAKRHFAAALAREPENALLLNAVAYQLALDGVELDLAQSYVLRALASDPANPNYLDTLGWVLCRKGEPSAAAPLLRAAVALTEGVVPEIDAHIDECESAAVPARSTFHVEH